MAQSPKSTWRRRTMAAACLATAYLATSADARGYGASHLVIPRTYNYHRRPGVDFMSDMLNMPVHFNSLFRQQEARLARLQESTEPTYHVEELPNGEIELTVDVPGVSASDLTVELLEEGNLLRISGARKFHGSVVEFNQLFRVDKDVDADNLSVRLASGVLRISAPKKEKVIKKLPILEESEDEVEALAVSDKDETDPAMTEVTEEVDGMTITEDKE